MLHVRRAGLAGYEQRLYAVYCDNVYLIARGSVYRRPVVTYAAVFPVVFDARAHTAEFSGGNGAEMNEQLEKRSHIGQIVPKSLIAVAECALAVLVIFKLRYPAAALKGHENCVVSCNLFAVDSDVLGSADFQRYGAVRLAGGADLLQELNVRHP